MSALCTVSLCLLSPDFGHSITGTINSGNRFSGLGSEGVKEAPKFQPTGLELQV